MQNATRYGEEVSATRHVTARLRRDAEITKNYRDCDSNAAYQGQNNSYEKKMRAQRML